jgi:hypothetical protein
MLSKPNLLEMWLVVSDANLPIRLEILYNQQIPSLKLVK